MSLVCKKIILERAGVCAPTRYTFEKRHFLVFFENFSNTFFQALCLVGAHTVGWPNLVCKVVLGPKRHSPHMTFSLFLSKFWKSRNFGDFGHFSTNFACGTHFQEVPERGLGVFQANVAIWRYKTCILTGSTQNPAPKRICTQMAHPVPLTTENARFQVPFLN